ncbi:MAG TPA: hypothetical protein VEC37_12220, partial [Bacillota bacterium]|nr:hypothetical protein [Bacillota bacterium]
MTNWIVLWAVIGIIFLAFTPLLVKLYQLLKQFDQFLPKFNQKYYKYLLSLIALVAVGIRLWKFGIIPFGFNQDGAMGAVDALALADHGTDRF